MEMIFRVSGWSSIRPRPDSRQRLSRDQTEALDCAPIVQIRLPNTIDIGGRTPGMRSSVFREPVRRRAIAPVSRDVDQRPDGFPEPLQTHCQEGYCARNVPGECAQRRGLPYIDLNELPKQKMGGQFD